LAWLLNHPSGIIPVLGSGNIDRIKHSVKAAKIKLTREQWFSVWCTSTGADLP
jgi:predicted oxidoreductase